ncbi:hypothetical protein HPB51_022647 [Rhipicephalus microplus]|uniref:Tubulin--tyrosine ligase-like protein 12 SET-like domain-containing protein n=1 Tax=Rhipicephalus microplus TaxID=6941 RepID=A0A9J6E3J2_RHIMP|nr:hypothetical protein HPB51_022647 [Rhipicephalus microplus]
MHAKFLALTCENAEQEVRYIAGQLQPQVICVDQVSSLIDEWNMLKCDGDRGTLHLEGRMDVYWAKVLCGAYWAKPRVPGNTGAWSKGAVLREYARPPWYPSSGVDSAGPSRASSGRLKDARPRNCMAKSSGCVYLVDHAWTCRPQQARQQLREMPRLLHRMAQLMGVLLPPDYTLGQKCINMSGMAKAPKTVPDHGSGSGIAPQHGPDATIPARDKVQAEDEIAGVMVAVARPSSAGHDDGKNCPPANHRELVNFMFGLVLCIKGHEARAKQRDAAVVREATMVCTPAKSMYRIGWRKGHGAQPELCWKITEKEMALFCGAPNCEDHRSR